MVFGSPLLRYLRQARMAGSFVGGEGPPSLGSWGHIHDWQQCTNVLAYQCVICQAVWPSEAADLVSAALTPPYGVPAIVRLEGPCPTCRTVLYDDEPNCWKCGWRRA